MIKFVFGKEKDILAEFNNQQKITECVLLMQDIALMAVVEISSIVSIATVSKTKKGFREKIEKVSIFSCFKRKKV